MSCHLSIACWKRLELRFCRARIPRTDNNKQSFLEGGTTSLFTAEQSSAYSITSKKLPTAKGAPVCVAGGSMPLPMKGLPPLHPAGWGRLHSHMLYKYKVNWASSPNLQQYPKTVMSSPRSLIRSLHVGFWGTEGCFKALYKRNSAAFTWYNRSIQQMLW